MASLNPASIPAPRALHKWWLLANVSVGVFMATLDGSIANVALPTISTELHVSLNLVQWVVTAYLLTICAMLPIVGKLSDLWGRGLLYNVGFLLFAFGSALCGLSHSILLLILMRIVQALGASLLMANSQALVSSTFPGHERGRALGITGAMVSIGSLTGPALGGVLIGALGWSSIFWINVPIGIIGFIAGLRFLPRRQSASASEPFDAIGSALFIIAIVLLLLTTSNAESLGWTSWPTLSGYAIAIVAFAGLFLRESRIRFPVIDFRLYRIRAFRAGSIAALLSFVSLFCTNIMVPFYLQGVLHASTSVTGYTMAAYPFTMVIVAPLSGFLSDKIGPFFLTTGGLTINAIGFCLLNLLGPHDKPWTVALLLAIFGIGQGMFQSPNNSSVMGSVPKSRLGLAGGLNALVRNIGMILGISLSVSLLSFRMHRLTGHLVHIGGHVANTHDFLLALHTVFWAAACVCVLGVLMSATRTRQA